jgi:hypothetical protein
METQDEKPQRADGEGGSQGQRPTVPLSLIRSCSRCNLDAVDRCLSRAIVTLWVIAALLVLVGLWAINMAWLDVCNGR